MDDGDDGLVRLFQLRQRPDGGLHPHRNPTRWLSGRHGRAGLLRRRAGQRRHLQHHGDGRRHPRQLLLRRADKRVERLRVCRRQQQRTPRRPGQWHHHADLVVRPDGPGSARHPHHERRRLRVLFLQRPDHRNIPALGDAGFVLSGRAGYAGHAGRNLERRGRNRRDRPAARAIWPGLQLWRSAAGVSRRGRLLGRQQRRRAVGRRARHQRGDRHPERDRRPEPARPDHPHHGRRRGLRIQFAPPGRLHPGRDSAIRLHRRSRRGRDRRRRVGRFRRDPGDHAAAWPIRQRLPLWRTPGRADRLRLPGCQQRRPAPAGRGRRPQRPARPERDDVPRRAGLPRRGEQLGWLLCVWRSGGRGLCHRRIPTQLLPGREGADRDDRRAARPGHLYGHAWRRPVWRRVQLWRAAAGGHRRPDLHRHQRQRHLPDQRVPGAGGQSGPVWDRRPGRGGAARGGQQLRRAVFVRQSAPGRLHRHRVPAGRLHRRAGQCGQPGRHADPDRHHRLDHPHRRRERLRLQLWRATHRVGRLCLHRPRR